MIHNPFLHGVLAFVLWGSFPVYFKLVQDASADEILCHRIIWSVVVLVAFLLFTRRFEVLKLTLFNEKLRSGLLLTSLIIALNWLVYIWAVNNQHALQASLGYFICPLISCLFGYLFHGERMRPLQKFALLFAIAGVAVPLLALGRVPWIALCLALSFASYGTLRKQFQANPIAGLCVEALVLTPFALLWLIWLALDGHMAFISLGPAFSFYLMMAGLITALPLVLFASAANQIPLTAVGFLQYIAPSLQFLLAVFAFGEAFTFNDGVSFALIWTGLLIYSIDQVRRRTAPRQLRSM
ncbi:MAG: Protein RarD [Gammaproteobacteria bacterium]|nr:Protein RarD [Gammaproteobacteria bacterium]